MHLLDIYIVFLLVLLVAGGCINNNPKDYLSKEAIVPLRGVCAVMILLHHIVQGHKCFGIMKSLRSMGFVFTGFFFFMSGYGLIVSVSKNPNYREHFLKKRVFPIILEYFIVTMLYFFYESIKSGKVLISSIFAGLPKGEPLLPYSWYVIVILLYYCWFYLTISLTTKPEYLVFSSILFYVLFSIFCICVNWGDWYYDTAFLLVIGNIWGILKEKTDAFIRKFWWLLLVVACSGFFITLIEYYMNFQSSVLKMLFATGNTLSFTIILLMLSVKFLFNNAILRRLGNLSLEIYLVQGISIDFLIKDRELSLYNVGLCVLVSVMLALAIHVLVRYFNKILQENQLFAKR